MPKSAADILRGGGDSVKLKEFVGQTITVVDFEVRHTTKFGGSEFVIMEVIDADGNEVDVMGGGHLIRTLQKLEKSGYLPLDVVVSKFDTDKGNPGFGLDPVDE